MLQLKILQLKMATVSSYDKIVIEQNKRRQRKQNSRVKFEEKYRKREDKHCQHEQNSRTISEGKYIKEQNKRRERFIAKYNKKIVSMIRKKSCKYQECKDNVSVEICHKETIITVNASPIIITIAIEFLYNVCNIKCTDIDNTIYEQTYIYKRDVKNYIKDHINTYIKMKDPFILIKSANKT